MPTRIAKTHLLAAVRWQIEHQYSEEGDAHAGDDEIYGVEERLTAHCDVERDVEVRFIAAGVEFLIPHCWHFQNVPLYRRIKLRQIHTDLYDV
jgi:hypothetical protein